MTKPKLILLFEMTWWNQELIQRYFLKKSLYKPLNSRISNPDDV